MGEVAEATQDPIGDFGYPKPGPYDVFFSCTLPFLVHGVLIEQGREE